MGVLTSRASDIYLSDEELCEAIGYLATPGRMIRIEAQVPYAKKTEFERAYPGQNYYWMEPWANKQSYQLRILMNRSRNCPAFLASHITAGGGSTADGCISRGLFVENLVEYFGFRFQDDYQDVNRIRNCVQNRFPTLMMYFDRGYNIPL
jgi:hypothetical protein